MKKVAIITMFNGGRNYGGVLQSYALNRKIRSFGCEAEHLNFKMKVDPSTTMTMKKLCKLGFLKAVAIVWKKIIVRCIFGVFYKLKVKIHEKELKEATSQRNKAFDEFKHTMVPNSKTTYTDDTIKNAVEEYDIFVTGSDQVWNPIWYNSAYRLDFVPSNVPKFSYAASVSVESLTDAQRKTFKSFLNDYIGVSVREQETVELLKPLSKVEPVCSLDPTLLLSKEEWDEIVPECSIQEPYMFCYFLGSGKKYRKLSQQYAKKHNVKIVMVPHLHGYNSNDKKYSDILMSDVSPQKFISLIKYANIIMTDSFHASVFSTIYSKNFFAFPREGFPGMNLRLLTLTKMFAIQNHFCDSKEKVSIEYIENNSNKCHYDDTKYLEKKHESELFLSEMLNKSLAN